MVLVAGVPVLAMLVVDVVQVLHGRVAAGGAVDMHVPRVGQVERRHGPGHVIDVVDIEMMDMPIVEVVEVVAVRDGGVATPPVVLVVVGLMGPVVQGHAVRHATIFAHRPAGPVGRTLVG
jgi:hypothetical protein